MRKILLQPPFFGYDLQFLALSKFIYNKLAYLYGHGLAYK